MHTCDHVDRLSVRYDPIATSKLILRLVHYRRFFVSLLLIYHKSIQFLLTAQTGSVGLGRCGSPLPVASESSRESNPSEGTARAIGRRCAHHSDWSSSPLHVRPLRPCVQRASKPCGGGLPLWSHGEPPSDCSGCHPGSRLGCRPESRRDNRRKCHCESSREIHQRSHPRSLREGRHEFHRQRGRRGKVRAHRRSCRFPWVATHGDRGCGDGGDGDGGGHVGVAMRDVFSIITIGLRPRDLWRSLHKMASLYWAAIRDCQC